MDAVAARHPAIAQMRALIALAVLLKGVRDLPACPDLEYWMAAYPVANVLIPSEIPMIKRSVSGLGHSCCLKGGVVLRPELYRARAGEAPAVREVILATRPYPDALMWTVDFVQSRDGYAANGNASSESALLFDFLLKRDELCLAQHLLETEAVDVSTTLQDSLRSRLSLLMEDHLGRSSASGGGGMPTSIAAACQRDHGVPRAPEHRLAEFIDSLEPRTTPAWSPSSSGANLLEIEARFSASWGSKLLTYPPNYCFLGGHKFWSLRLPTTLKLVFANRLEFSLSIPFEIVFGDVMVPNTYIGRENIFGITGGVGNVAASLSLLVLTGSGDWPSVKLGHERAFEEYGRENTYSSPVSGGLRMPFGVQSWQSQHFLESRVRLFKALHMVMLGGAFGPWNDNDYQWAVAGAGIFFSTTPSRLWPFCGFGVLSNHYRQLGNISNDLPRHRMFLFFLEHINRHGVFPSTIGIGAGHDNSGRKTYITVEASLTQLNLFSVRKWF